MAYVEGSGNGALPAQPVAKSAGKSAEHAHDPRAVKPRAFPVGKPLARPAQQPGSGKPAQRMPFEPCGKPCFGLPANGLLALTQPGNRHAAFGLADNGSSQQQRVFAKAFGLYFKLLRQAVAVAVYMLDENRL